jgi:CBS domain containing-hemolysin-like protein
MAQPSVKPKLEEALKPAVESESEQAGLLKRFKGWLRVNLRGRHHDNSLKEALEEVLEEHEEDGEQLPDEEQNMLKNVLEFGDLTVRDIMTPRTDIKAVEYNIGLDELKAHISQHRHTRIPVFNDTLDNVKGFVHIKDLVPLLSGDTPFNMALILRDILFVPPSMKLINLLVDMRKAGVHMAIVVDEYGGTDGLATLEDLFEEIVGDIQDEHDEEEENALNWTSQGVCDVDARIPIERLEAELALPLKSVSGETQFDTLGGLIFHQLGRVPGRHEIITHVSGAKFEILAADPRRIQRVRIYAPVKTEEDGTKTAP